MTVIIRDDAFTGLEAAIVLIAFVVVAAVFAYVVLGAGFFTTQKSQETIYKGIEQASSNIQIVGQVYGTSSSVSSNLGVESITFTIGLAPGSPSQDLTKMRIVWSNETSGPTTYTWVGEMGELNYGKFMALDARSGASLTSLVAGNQTVINFSAIQGDPPNSNVAGKNSVMTIEIRPAVGAPIPFTRTVPNTISGVMALY